MTPQVTQHFTSLIGAIADIFLYDDVPFCRLQSVRTVSVALGGGGVKVDQEREADHLHSYCAQVTNMWKRSPTVLYAFILAYETVGVGTAQCVQWLGCGLNDWGIVDRIPAGRKDFLFESIHTGCGAHPIFVLSGCQGLLPGSKVVREWSWPLSSI